MAAEFPGYTGRLQPKDGTIAEYLRARLQHWHAGLSGFCRTATQSRQ
jgi:hypothetical protein